MTLKSVFIQIKMCKTASIFYLKVPFFYVFTDQPVDRLTADFELLGEDESSSSDEDEENLTEDQWVLVRSKSGQKVLTVEQNSPGDGRGAKPRDYPDNPQSKD